MQKKHFPMFAQYNGWANRKLLTAVAELSEAEYNQDCQVAFKSMNGTLNHLLIADTIWLSRFQGTNDAPTSLDGFLHDKFADYLEARRLMDDKFIQYAEGLTAVNLNGDFSYTPITTPEKVTLQLAPALAHIFNHQTHHRGQAHAILTRLKGEAPPLDLIYYQLEVRSGLV
ncbi:MAG: DinB family protein [Rhizobiaceae bacterium]